MLDYLTRGFFLIILLSGLPLAIGALAGLCVSFLQAVTQIQEQALNFVVKFLILVGFLYCCGSWVGSELIEYLQQGLKGMKYVGVMGAFASCWT